MAEETTMHSSTQTDKLSFYKNLHDYITKCVLPQSNSASKHADDTLSSNDSSIQTISPLSRNDEGASECTKRFDDMIAYIGKSLADRLDQYVDACIQLSKCIEDDEDWTTLVATVIKKPQSLELFRRMIHGDFDFYPTLKKLWNTFHISEYYELSLDPRAALYGCTINDSDKVTTFRMPAKNEDILAILSAILLHRSDSDHLAENLVIEWFIAILYFDPTHMQQAFQKEFADQRSRLKCWVIEYLEHNDKQKKKLSFLIVKESSLKPQHRYSMSTIDSHSTNRYAEATAVAADLQKRNSELEETVHSIEKEKRDLQKRIDDLRMLCQRHQDNERDARTKLENLSIRYRAQIKENEVLMIHCEEKEKELSNRFASMQTELQSCQALAASQVTAMEALQVDYTMKASELEHLRESVAQLDQATRSRLLKELITGLNEQLYYLTLYYLELHDNSTLSPDTIGMFCDTLRKIDTELERLGIKKIGTIDQTVPYDSRLHSVSGGSAANGDTVTVTGYGWTIDGNVVIKAPVEKGVE